EQRLLIVLEEMQHLPPSSLDLLSYLAARLAGAQVMFVLTLRPTDTAPAALSRLRAFASDDAGHVTRGLRVSLSPLTVEQSIAALRDVAQTSGIPASSVARVARQCAGNPLRLFHAARAVAAGEQPAQSPVRTLAVLRSPFWLREPPRMRGNISSSIAPSHCRRMTSMKWRVL